MKFLVVSCGRNGKPFLEDWWDGVISQTWDGAALLVVDDASTDGSGEWLRARIPTNTHTERLICRDTPKRAVWNKTRAIFESGYAFDLDPDDVIVGADMDDYLLPHALDTLGDIFSDPDVWFSYGNCCPLDASWDVCRPFDWRYPLRAQEWPCVHPRAARWFLWQSVHWDDLEGRAWPEDRILTYPMLEMAGPEHVHCERQVLSMYRNRQNPAADMIVHQESVADELSRVLSASPYPCRTRKQLLEVGCDWSW